ncbi:MAG: alpha/beta hydrolase [Gammaproteobacteria bacterium]|nr:alpha/beta hydrolase [Gammaproteobacteria bacterium]MYD01057.1 alpha/beta hydrolase [Gammaproteobacteria bacterium]MYI23935.1 alpha/beta hydrolase [Gammaproteobacteria bacterium]
MIRKQYVDGPHGQVHLRVAGAEAGSGRRSVMCFHMSPNSGLVYESILAELGRDRLAVAPDTPGFGASDAPAKPPEIEDYADAMEAVADQLGLDEFDLIGYHTGSKTAVELGLRRPEQVRHVVMISAPLFTKEELDEHRSLYAAKPIAEDGSHLVMRWKGFIRWHRKHHGLEKAAAMFTESLRGGDKYWWGHRAAFNYPLWERMPTLKVPLLVLNPEDDLWKQSLRAPELIRNGGMVNLPGWGHGFLDAYTPIAGAMLREFFDRDRLPETPAECG